MILYDFGIDYIISFEFRKHFKVAPTTYGMLSFLLSTIIRITSSAKIGKQKERSSTKKS